MTSPDAEKKALFLSKLNQSAALTFGTFTLKSGRVSPYFFQSAKLSFQPLARSLGVAFSDVLSTPPFSLPFGTEDDGAEADGSLHPQFDILFGPAYKGISLAGIITSHLPDDGRFANVSYVYNRKEAKAHGEGGMMVGESMKGKRVCVIDDVLTAGTALREAVSIIKAQGGILVGVVLLLTRQERVSDEEPRSALKVAEDELGVPVRAVVTFQDVIEAVEAGKIKGAGPEQLEQMKKYRDRYGSQD